MIADEHFLKSCVAGRRGCELDEPERPVCQHVSGCESRERLVFCECSELLCEDHTYVCATKECDVILGDCCGVESVHDQQYRCMAHHREHMAKNKERAA